MSWEASGAGMEHGEDCAAKIPNNSELSDIANSFFIHKYLE